MAKQLRLDVAQLTDVGRKREHNEDNMAYVIPKDPMVMAKKGALFIVADGMGGHAAGEVASEIAVDTVSNAYYQNDNDDVAVSLLQAIKRANALIHQRASENMLRSGMGTTCVAGVLRGNMGFIANVGDSRAYLVRNNMVKQITQDHSWVAEQVRAGLLTEEQARTHAQRNVITRCLGTQADVDVDIFAEELEEGDSLILCTDGLAGLVGDDEIRKIVGQFMPQESVYHLVERANENGGPDNITAIVVRVQEVGSEASSNGRRAPVRIGGRETGEDSALLGMPGLAGSFSIRSNDGRIPSSPLRSPSGQLSISEGDTAPNPVIKATRQRRSRLFYPTLALLVLFVLALAGGGAYYYYQKVNQGISVDQSLQNAQNLITQATGEVASNNATAALADLAHAQNILQNVQKGTLTDAQRTQVNTLLSGTFTKAVKDAIMSYNQASLISALPCSNTTTSPINEGSTGTHAQQLALVENGTGGAPVTYALAQNATLYQLDSQHSLVSPLTFNDGSQVLAIAGDDTRLFFLKSQPGKSGAQTSYYLGQVAPGNSQVSKSVQIDERFIKNGQVPILLAAWGSDVYVVLSSTGTPNNALIFDYNADTFTTDTPKQSTIAISQSITSIAAFPNHLLFLLLADGSVQSLQFSGTGTGQTATPVLISHTLPQVLAVGDKDYNANVAVPPVLAQAPGGSIALKVGPSQTGILVTGPVNAADKVPYLYLVDPDQHRILDLKTIDVTTVNTPTPTPAPTKATGAGTPTATPTPTTTVGGGSVGSSGENTVTMQLVQQYTSSSLLAQIKSVAVDPKNPSLSVLTVSNQAQSTYSLLSVDTSTQNVCP